MTNMKAPLCGKTRGFHTVYRRICLASDVDGEWLGDILRCREHRKGEQWHNVGDHFFLLDRVSVLKAMNCFLDEDLEFACFVEQSLVSG